MFDAPTSYIDIGQIAIWMFWFFFAGLVYYLRREDKREGYPLESERSQYVKVVGFPNLPEPKTFILPHGQGTKQAPPSGARVQGQRHAGRALAGCPLAAHR